ncbi:uncharacterized protein LOC121372163 [Gigantopelta aegis]|uniref:uncharacterized protein LOC121372163 n=1 Tax=Gigantopelta aegis TaxID=1735272 RepID=UPI001B88DFE3|nr:uncharacterized protein LOC121372163 [Gigantopelta aegis]
MPVTAMYIPKQYLKQVKDFLENYRDRYQRVRKTKSGQAIKILTSGDNWIITNFQFLSKYIRQTLSVSSHAIADLEEEDDTQDTQDAGFGSDSELGMPTSSPPQRPATPAGPRGQPPQQAPGTKGWERTGEGQQAATPAPAPPQLQSQPMNYCSSFLTEPRRHLMLGWEKIPSTPCQAMKLL